MKEKFRLMNFGIALEQGETLKRQASDAGENMASKAKTAKKEVEKQSEGVMDSVLNVLNDVKDSVFGQESFFFGGETKSIECTIFRFRNPWIRIETRC